MTLKELSYVSKFFLFLFIKSMVVNLPTSKNLSLNWNYGSMLGFVLFFQILSGVLLVFYYSSDESLAFFSVQYIMYESFFGFLIRLFHFNGASLFFFFIFLHFFKGLFFCSYRLNLVWFSGLVIFFLLMMEAFMGYVLVWAQMSFWACIVITSLLSVIPIFGNVIVNWVWGGFSIGSPVLKFFFIFHFLLPFVLLLIVVGHLLLLHDSGSTSKVFCLGDYDKVCFYPYYWLKDSYNFIFFCCFFIFSLLMPFILGDSEMFLESDSLVSPVHIVPEWYFLFAYAMLRAIPNKLLGVLILIFSIACFFSFCFFKNYYFLLDKFNTSLVFIFFFNGLYLSWLGQCLVEDPYLMLGGLLTFFYFLLFFFIFLNYFLGFLLFSYHFIMMKMY